MCTRNWPSTSSPVAANCSIIWIYNDKSHAYTRCCLPGCNDATEVNNHRPGNESVSEFLLQQALIGAQVLAPGGTLLFTHVGPYLRPDVFQTLMCIASCFTRVRFVRHELKLYVKVGCACVFEGFRGYTESRAAQLWSYYTAIRECTFRPNQLFRVDALPSHTRVRRIHSWRRNWRRYPCPPYAQLTPGSNVWTPIAPS